MGSATHILVAEESVAAVVCKRAGILEHLLQRSNLGGNVVLLFSLGIFGGWRRRGLESILSAFAGLGTGRLDPQQRQVGSRQAQSAESAGE